ncbi:MAG: hypothetical protein RMJ53_04125 [Chitinophagales bacterium]|nr:hypothetical protein [Chitinophagales bacterium]MDW8273401.1 hypothetical protein [Chitinophagales bacterium]
MTFYPIRKFFFRQALKPVSAQNHHLLAWEDIHEVLLLLYDAEMSLAPEFQEVLKILLAEKKNVHTLAFVRKVSDEAKFLYDYFTSKDVKWNLVPDNALIRKFIQKKADLLIAFYPHENLTLDFIVHHSAAICRAGVYHPSKTQLFELMLKPQEAEHPINLLQMLEQTMYYLNKVNATV